MNEAAVFAELSQELTIGVIASLAVGMLIVAALLWLFGKSLGR